jgi:23S rRNA (cytidine2498-2'-O)-methyltransferase
VSAARVLVYCRAGFEKECAQELSAAAALAGVAGFVKARPDSAFAVFQPHDEAAGSGFASGLAFAELVFARQLVRALDLTALTAEDRVRPIVAAVGALGTTRFAALWLEMPDTNEGRALAALTRTLAPHLERALRSAGIAFTDESAAERLHVFFVGGLACYVGTSRRDAASPWPMGIPRLRMPSSAPSRSTLKLAEAFSVLLGEEEAARTLAPGMRAIDLGASPGGWTWQLVRRGLMVTAVDNGPMDAALLDSGQVRQRREDGFGFEPAEPAEWMVCDMVESPSRIARLAGRWIARGWCRRTIFNLKLPMKRRWEEVNRCRELIAEELAGRAFDLRVKQLYHDREEVTAYLAARAKEPLHWKKAKPRRSA